MKRSTKVVAVAVLLACALLAAQLFLSGASFSPTNLGWDGISVLAIDHGVQPLGDFAGLQGARSGDVALIIGPTANYSSSDAAEVASFLARGGRVVVMDDFGSAGQLLEELNAPVMFYPVPLCQDLDYYQQPSLPVITKFSGGDLTANVSRLVLNSPVSLKLDKGARVLARTTGLGWLDINNKSNSYGRFDGNEVFGIYTVAASVPYDGGGELIVIGDADVFVNGMLSLADDKGRYDNSVLLANALGNGTAYLDVGHGQSLPPLADLYYIVKYNLVAQIICVLIILGLGCAYMARGRLRKKDKPGREGATGRETVAHRRAQVGVPGERAGHPGAEQEALGGTC